MADGLGDFLGVLSRLGRGGGMFAIVLGAGVSALGFWLGDGRVIGLGLVIAVVGLYVLVTGGGRRFKPLQRSELLERVRSEPFPFALCVNCFLLLPRRLHCPRCGEDAMSVTNDAERDGARRALDLGPAS